MINAFDVGIIGIAASITGILIGSFVKETTIRKLCKGFAAEIEKAQNKGYERGYADGKNYVFSENYRKSRGQYTKKGRNKY